jgi:hypothetical protein
LEVALRAFLEGKGCPHRGDERENVNMSRIGFRARTLRTSIAFVAAGLLGLASARASIVTNIVTDGYGDGDRDNNGLDAGATATNPSDVGIPWYDAAGTSAFTFQATDDSAGIGSGNALQVFNTGSNNRPMAGHFTSQALNDGDSLALSFDMRLLSSKNTSNVDVTADRAIRFGIYNDSGTWTSGDKGSSDLTYNDDVGYNARVDSRADVSNSTSMDVTRDDTSDTAAILQATATSLGISSTNAVNQLVDTNKHHFVLTLTRNGTTMAVSLQQDSNAAISGTDATPPGGFIYNEIAFGVRSNAAMDLRIDNVSLDYTAAPEPAAFTLLTLGAAAGSLRRRRRTC